MPTDNHRKFSDADPALDPEFARVLRISDPGMALDGPLTFLPPLASSHAGWLDAWRAWLEGTFALTLGPCLTAAAVHAEQGAARELQALDLALDAGLDAAVRARSVAAGRRLLRRLANARGERWLDKFQTWAAEDRTPAHFCVVFAGAERAFSSFPTAVAARLRVLGMVCGDDGPAAHGPTAAGVRPRMARAAAAGRRCRRTNVSRVP